MLVLTRKRNEAIVFYLGGTKVSVRMLSAGNQKVSLGIEAPRSVKILREELCQQVEETNA